ncbi:ABC transporter permease [Faecalicatena sp. Marseille-Q4148]|nr:ABC transporter permease [Faecalicatena sp. Marseille-Q4148]
MKSKEDEKMLKFIGKRLAFAVLTLFLIATATFFLVAGAPGDPIAAKVGQMPEQAQAIINAKYGFDRPVVERYFMYMKNLITTGDFGESIIYTGKSANDIIRDNTLISAKIGLLAILFQVTIGVLLGLVAALNRGKPIDHAIRIMVVLAICVPSFVFAALLQYFLAFKWKLVPVFGWGELKHYILPVAAYAIGGIASYCKYTRNSTLSVISEDYIITAKAKGCTKKRVVRKHILRNSMIPIVTMIGPAVAGIFAGSFIIEKMFAIPGLGSYYVKAVSDNDYTMVIGLTIFFAMLYVAALIIVDILYGIVDPRIRVTKGKK